jgi:hypothetical protein|tara:strand:+ start:3948 stop:4079 length:132 start_codon:yes stop_codon:yes gene_type:complete
MQHHHYRLEELENMMPWEREVYLMMIDEWVTEENERIRMENQK